MEDDRHSGVTPGRRRIEAIDREGRHGSWPGAREWLGRVGGGCVADEFSVDLDRHVGPNVGRKGREAEFCPVERTNGLDAEGGAVSERVLAHGADQRRVEGDGQRHAEECQLAFDLGGVVAGLGDRCRYQRSPAGRRRCSASFHRAVRH